VAELIGRLRGVGPERAGGYSGDIGFALWAGGTAALALALALALSIQAAIALVAVVSIVALHEYDRGLGIYALFAFWFLAPLARRLLALSTGHVGNDPLSLAPFIATAAIAAIEVFRTPIPREIRNVLLLGAVGFAIGLPLGLLAGPRAAVYAFVAYLAGMSGAVLGLNEPRGVPGSTLRKVLLYGMPPLAAYAILQREIILPTWDFSWLESIDFASVGDPKLGPVRAFASLNGPGALAPLLGLSVLCYLTVRRARPITLVGLTLVVLALSMTFVRSAWVALLVAGVAHVAASRGRSARPVLGAVAVMVAASIALSPVSSTAQDVVNRFKSITNREDTSTTERRATVGEVAPTAIGAPLGHGLGTAGEASRLGTQESDLRHPDNGYLSLLYQSGPIGLLLVLIALGYITRAAWVGARDPAPGQDMRQLLFALLVFMLVVLYTGDSFYGSHGVILWLIGGQVLASDYLLRQGRPRPGLRDAAPT
jgi:hypothetical protein